MKRNLPKIGAAVILFATSVFATITPVVPDTDKDGCYLISDKQELYGFAKIVNSGLDDGKTSVNGNPAACGKLDNDIVVNKDVFKADGSVNESGMEEWEPIGKSYNSYFKGTFDGQNHYVSGLYKSKSNTSTYYPGLFGIVGNNTADVVIKNVGVVNSYFGGSVTGAVVAQVHDTCSLVLENVYSENNLLIGSDGIGGLLGSTYRGKAFISNSYAYNAKLGRTNNLNDYCINLVGAGTRTIVNSYGSAEMFAYRYSESEPAWSASLIIESRSEITFYTDEGEYQISTSALTNGLLAQKLHGWCEKDGEKCKENGLNGSKWGQKLSGSSPDAFPNLRSEYEEPTQLSLSVKLDAGNGTFASGKELTSYEYGEGSVTLPTAADVSYKNHTFAGWYDNENFEGSPVTEFPKNDLSPKVFYAKWVMGTIPETKDDCYQIKDMYDLFGFAQIVNNGFGGVEQNSSACAVLLDNITLNTNVLNPDGSVNAQDSVNFIKWTPINSYKGTFDGNGKTISGLYVNTRNTSQGLIGSASFGMLVKNLGIVDSYIHGYSYVGGFVGYYHGDTSRDIVLENVYFFGTVSSEQNDAGLFAGLLWYATIRNSFYKYGANLIGSMNYVNLKNVFCLTDSISGALEGVYLVSKDALESGAVTTLLHNGVNGSIWGQKLTRENPDKYPNFTTEYTEVSTTFDVTLHLGKNATIAESANISSYVAGEGKNLPTATEISRDGYDFAGWYDNPKFTGTAVGEITPYNVGKREYYAKWNVSSQQAPEKDEDNCYIIASKNDLYGFAQLVNSKAAQVFCAKLTDDIYLNESVLENYTIADNYLEFDIWEPINYPNANITINGQNHTIHGLYTVGNFTYAGFLGEANKVKIDSLNFVDSYIEAASSNWYVAGIIAKADDSLEITNSSFDGVIIGKSEYASGLAGYVYGALKISNSFHIGPISNSSANYTSGIVGYIETSANIKNSYHMGKITGKVRESYSGVGGIWGRIKKQPNVENCFYSAGDYTIFAEGSTALPQEFFENGVVARLLHDGEDGKIWGQNITEGDMHPNFSGELTPEHSLEFNVVLDAKSGTIAEGKNVTSYTYGIAVALPTGDDVQREGMAFGGWFDNADFEGDAITEIPASHIGDIILYAKWMRGKIPEYTDNCFVIAEVAELEAFADMVNGDHGSAMREKATCARLSADIHLNGKVLENGELVKDASGLEPWIPIGTSEKPFVGTFDGAGHVVTGIYIIGESGYSGLFGYVGRSENTSIVNLGIEDSYIKNEYAGSLVGKSTGNLKVTNSYSANTVIEGTSEWGFVGYTEASLNVENSFFYGENWSKTVTYSKASLDNVYYLYNKNTELAPGVNGVTADVFSLGLVATLLHNWNESGEIWGQDLTAEIPDMFPKFTDVFNGSPEYIFTVMLELNGGALAKGMAKFEYKYGEGTTLPLSDDISREGFLFAGWYDNEEFKGSSITGVAQNGFGSKTFYAKWVKGVIPKLVENCYEIGTKDELYGFAAIANGEFGKEMQQTAVCAKLTADIVLNEDVLLSSGILNEGKKSTFDEWTPINILGDDVEHVFDGQGHIVSGMYIPDNGEGNNNADVGFFGKVSNLTIKNFGIEDSYIDRNASLVGSIVGNGDSVKMTNVYSTASVVPSFAWHVGGLVGGLSNSLISNSFYAGKKLTGAPLYQIEESYERTNVIENVFYPDIYVQKDHNAQAMPAEAFTDGTVAALLQSWCEKDSDGKCLANGENGKIWGQETQGKNPDELPKFYTNGSKKIVFSVKLDAGKGKIAEGKNITTYTFGTEVALPTSSSMIYDGYKFADWYDNTEYKGTVVKKIASTDYGNKTFYAKWEKIATSSSSSSSSAKAKSSSSSAKAKSSSSSAKAKSSSSKNVIASSSSAKQSSSSKGKSAIELQMVAPQFRVTTIGREMQIAGARKGCAYAVFDMQGRMVLNGRVDAENFNLFMPRSGSYVLRIASEMQVVNIQ